MISDSIMFHLPQVSFLSAVFHLHLFSIFCLSSVFHSPHSLPQLPSSLLLLLTLPVFVPSPQPLVSAFFSPATSLSPFPSFSYPLILLILPFPLTTSLSPILSFSSPLLSPATSLLSSPFPSPATSLSPYPLIPLILLPFLPLLLEAVAASESSPDEQMFLNASSSR